MKNRIKELEKQITEMVENFQPNPHKVGVMWRCCYEINKGGTGIINGKKTIIKL